MRVVAADSSREQLAALAQVGALLARADIEYWLFGGWAVDFHAGRVTRPHDDVDLAVWLDDLAGISSLLENAGWQHAPNEDGDGGTGYERGAVRLELTCLARDDEGVYTPLRTGRARWSEEALGDDTAGLEGVRSRLVTLAALTRSKTRGRDDPTDAVKDRADTEVLRDLAQRP